VIGLRITVPIACWRRARAREFLETEELPPPATAYGALLSYVGEVDRRRHIGARVTAGLFSQDRQKSTVLRSLWRVKDKNKPPGVGSNVRPDFQQLALRSDLLLLCDSSEETHGTPTLEERVRAAFLRPETVERFGGWSIGESTHLINDAWLIEQASLPMPCRVFELSPSGGVTMPVWVDHVGTAGTRYARGALVSCGQWPAAEVVPRISP
jgi:CRISPR-associated protein Cas5t